MSGASFNFIDLFAGIGGIRQAVVANGGHCVFSSEWDKFAQATYEANFGERPFGDITKIQACDIPDHHLLTAGFPCQPFSISGVSKKNSMGKAHGFLDETQGTLFFDVARIIKEKRPQAFLLENVKNLVSHDKGNTFKVILGTLKELGYDVHWKVLDAKWYVPQHRERTFIVGFREPKDFQFPHPPETIHRIKDILEPEVVGYTLSDGLWSYLQKHAEKHKAKGNGFGYGLVDLNGVSRTLTARYYKDGAEILIPQDGKNPRRLTPRECARLMGFPENFKIAASKSRAYKQFGNSVVVPLVKAIVAEIVKHIAKEK